MFVSTFISRLNHLEARPCRAVEENSQFLPSLKGQCFNWKVWPRDHYTIIIIYAFDHLARTLVNSILQEPFTVPGSPKKMEYFLFVIFVLLSSTSGNPVYKSHDERKESHISPQKVSLRIDLLCLFLLFLLLLPKNIVSYKRHFIQQGCGSHCSRWGGRARIQREHGGRPKQANRIVWSCRSPWSGSQWRLTWFQASKFHFSTICPLIFKTIQHVYMYRRVSKIAKSYVLYC